ncbi:MAG TPA: phage tail protein [Chloroflexota bacterium]|nr:phage tail protein [Chloroflexota bacterium]
MPFGKEPYLVSSFWIEVQGVIIAAFTDCAGLSITTEVLEYAEGGRNDLVYKLPVRTKFSNITLKRGWTTSHDLWGWYQEVVNGRITPRDCSIVMCAAHGENPATETGRINVFQAYPISWQGSGLTADSSSMAVESVELAHMGFQPG